MTKLEQLFSLFHSFSVEERLMFLGWARDIELALRYNDLELAIHVANSISPEWMQPIKQAVLGVLEA